MINGIVFSKDRACQLNLLLSSLEKNAKNIFETKVIYTSSNLEFEEGYEKLINQYPEVKWIKESSNFKEDVLSSIQNTESDYTCFFTDDDIVYRTLNEDDLTSKLKEDKDAFCFSTRLGLNTNKCYTMKCDNVIKPSFEDEKFIHFLLMAIFLEPKKYLNLQKKYLLKIQIHMRLVFKFLIIFLEIKCGRINTALQSTLQPI